MEDIKNFIVEFIQQEKTCNIAKWNINVSNNKYNKLKNSTYGFMHSYMSNPFGRAGVLEDLLEDVEEQKFALKKIKKITPRTLFQIKHYKDFTLGDSLKRIVTSKDLFACYVSYEQKTGYPIEYSKIFYVSETDEGLKIIYAKNYNTSEKHDWSHSHDLKVLQVLKEGTLLAVEKYQAPEEATSLADYNAN